MVQPHRTPMVSTPASYVGGPSIRFAVPSDSTAIPYNYKGFHILTNSLLMTVFSLDGKPMQLANQTRIY